VNDLFKTLLLALVQVLYYAILARVLISWLVIAGLRNDFLFRLDQVLGTFSDPIMRPLRRIIPPLGMIDITPLVAIILLVVIREAIARTL